MFIDVNFLSLYGRKFPKEQRITYETCCTRKIFVSISFFLFRADLSYFYKTIVFANTGPTTLFDTYARVVRFLQFSRRFYRIRFLAPLRL